MIITNQIIGDFIQTRQTTEEICAPLTQEDYVVQPTIDVSPPKWHLGHTTWFFEEFVLKKFHPDYTEYNPQFSYIFNSYYESMGDRILRTDRGNLTRPSVEEVYRYRDYVTNHLSEFLDDHLTDEIAGLITIGIHHEKQHQELLFTDIKYILGNNPLLPKYSETFEENTIEKQKSKWLKIPEGIYEIGHVTTDFCFDNELGKHKVFLHNYKISNKLITNEEYIEFIRDGGYNNFNFWHAEGWDWVKNNNIYAPLYWHEINGEWYQYTFKGLKPVELQAPVTHVSYYEAFAYAEWRGHRLPTEFEWEVAQEFFDWGKRWEWTESSYLPYPYYKKISGALGEYNGKFMVNQKVLRGGSVVTSKNHTRYTYRNFFHPHLRWQFTGIRLAKR
ncbi:ergothioneine biosynthesis protein EgtB [Galbibacter pacificus]|uniref:Ergothioneine biosynthesis protein EgtB n=1 Tax=Galbibacter pacificus TaxID=2996052 RepID=A0ABT6FMH1_9FLAO|nr:ergothioneine biosynthesis protein EgtB [Galbibacter pacificus]MDG3580978.1 ergothioneine biosynthesis protein EgtB [Galbibacter pacificus]MDG3584456.1 ergothioneine biosynthesis protein EgtB [Galbibacter pacificus]